jgi:hypothetical protein
MDDTNQDILDSEAGLSKLHISVIKSLYASPVHFKQFRTVRYELRAVEYLFSKGLVELIGDNVSLSKSGYKFAEYLIHSANARKEKESDLFNRPIETSEKTGESLTSGVVKQERDNPSNISEKTLSPEVIELKQKKLEKSNEFLKLYKEGFTYQEIGDKYELSKERVRQLLRSNPDFYAYLKQMEIEKSTAKTSAALQKVERSKQKLEAKSLAALYPERVAELWDYEKNGNLKPDDVFAGGAKQPVWLKCPIDGHSWRKKPNEISASWGRNGSNGCPVCAGKTKSRTDKPTLMEVYSDLVNQYWDLDKNTDLNLDPFELTLGSNRKVWFKCPYDGHEWQAMIASTIIQQWSKGNAGCRVCNGTASRNFKKGQQHQGQILGLAFPNELTKYWHFGRNDQQRLDPMKLRIGSGKEAWFRCPIDGHEWQATITVIAKGSWQKGNSGCPACRGFVATKATSLIGLFPDYIAQYWDHDKNQKLGLDPNELTRGSNSEAWFKCPIDGYEWKTRINGITKSAWSQGNNGCARCGSGWTLEAVRQFVASLESHIPNLTQAELYKIFEQSGVLDSASTEGLKIVKDVIKGKLLGQKLRDVLQGKIQGLPKTASDVKDSLDPNAELNVVDTVASINSERTNQIFEASDGMLLQPQDANELPSVRVQKSLEFLNSKIVASADEEAIEFFVASRRNRIWAEVFQDESAAEGVETFTDEGYGRRVRDEFLDEYNQAKNMAVPSGWAFRVEGKITPPNLMQKLAAVRLQNQKRMLNLSLTGTGKTIGGILSSRIIGARLTIIICPLDTVTNWAKEIKGVFPDSRVITKDFNPYWSTIDNGHHYVIFNHEMFQQPSTPSDIKRLLERFEIDLIIVDEIHRCKQRNDDPSKRRQMVLALITNAAEKNPDLHVLGMSATPIINNLKEGKSLVELVTGLQREDLEERATLNNCMRLHQAFVTLGIRSRVKPKISINRLTLPVDCTDFVEEIRENGTSVLKMEQILTRARIPAIVKELRPKTIVYTH